ncbi:hypothetical protein PLCT1_01755 [Planctomycetaceae bacterium]|nr:hypothetical protein PLCT1_01755 [Planctomycetaceae bacterium]
MATVSWTSASKETFEDAKTNGKALVLYFEDKSKDAKWAEDVDLADLQKKALVSCVVVSAPKDGDAKTGVSPAGAVPQNRLAAADLWLAYGSPAAGTFIVCDEYGNEFARSTEKKLEKTVTSLRKLVREARASVKESVQKAQKLVDAKDDGAAVQELLKAFKLNLTGWDEATSAAKLYNDIMGRAREQLAAAGDDEAKLKQLQKTFAGTDVSAEIDKALTKLAEK